MEQTEEGITSVTNVSIKHGWLNLPKTKAGNHEKFEFCNLLMRYTQDLTEETKNDLLLSSQTPSINKDDEIIDFRSFMYIGEHADRLGPNIPADVNEMMSNVARSMHAEIFTRDQRTEYVDTKTSRKITDNVSAIANVFRPGLVVLTNTTSDSLNFNTGSNIAFYRAVDRGFMPFGQYLSLPVDFIYNFDYLQNNRMRNERSGSMLPLFMVIGPSDELLSGRSIGRMSHSDKAGLSAVYTIAVREIKDMDGEQVKVADQAVATCFYVGKEKESPDNVANELITVCKQNTRSRIGDKMYKELAVIRIGSIPHFGNQPRVEQTNQGESVLLEQFKFESHHNWKTYSFFYSKTDSNYTGHENSFEEMRLRRESYSFWSDLHQEAIMEEEEEEDLPVEPGRPVVSTEQQAAAGNIPLPEPAEGEEYAFASPHSHGSQPSGAYSRNKKPYDKPASPKISSDFTLIGQLEKYADGSAGKSKKRGGRKMKGEDSGVDLSNL